MSRVLWLTLASWCAFGCSGSDPSKHSKHTPVRNNLQQVDTTGSLGPADPQASHSARSERTGRDPATSGSADPSGQNAAGPERRRIIYAAQVTLVVEDFAAVDTGLADLVKKFDGYVAESKVDRTLGAQRTGKWVVRVPVDRFDGFLDALVQLGVPEHRQTNAQDVTEEYVDLQARIATKKEIERRILRLLEDRSGDIKDVIAVENELGRVREEIERMEGRLRYLANVTALTTVTLAVREQQNYVPPQAPTFTAEIGQTWTSSVGALRDFGRGVTLFFVAVAPWVPVFAPPAGVLVWLIRRRGRRPVQPAA